MNKLVFHLFTHFLNTFTEYVITASFEFNQLSKKTNNINSIKHMK